ncbi:uncharacterized protein LOC130134382 isoform X1 [Syzygium oleosum]|uniref:uncharacterized protein LOC130134382 isoform X1 n=1 Tax=Syzygium oleosum TaxID=219896 RepID=UPI0024BB1BBC|nr:uncharacterized protein LOC130134382 isoform X1 [Syzygium oleosum]XP_056160292.1 uncharacterized protein LOC130134382 isoform X1 [Syzygium oleosum]XP_056160293.1 uncharacterized protein LOC130134382 isoform X1 [Syzygium oleosum]XP_056160294.1 uncharacterized protein LOC130134382 isoform X1 [Syzygium oleosum]
MESRTLFLHSVAFPPSPSPSPSSRPSSLLLAVSLRSVCFRNRALLSRCSVASRTASAGGGGGGEPSSARFQSLRVLEWDKLCDSVASFAGTSLGREAAKARLWSLDQTYEESMRLLSETNAAVEMHRLGGFSLDFSGIDAALVKSAIQRARRDSPMSGHEAIAVASLLQFADTLQLNLRAAIKEDADWHGRFMPLSEVILEFIVNRALIKLIQQVLDEDGSVKDSASPLLKRSREQVRMLEKRLHELMDKLMMNDRNESSFQEVSNVNGRWCIKSGMDKLTNLNGLLISSGSGNGNIIEPLAAVPLNDELQRARGSVAKAEEDVLLMLTKKMQMDLDETEILLNRIIQLDMINARATYSLSYGGTCPDLLLQEEKSRLLDAETSLSEHKISKSSNSMEWMLFLPKAYHPLLVQQHRLNLRKARKDLSSAAAEIGRRKMAAGMSIKGESEIDIVALKERVAAIEQAKPVAVDFFISRETKVLVITGPNTGGKTVCLKTIGLAALMAKSGLYILAAESVRIPWFDSVFADIGDEQSLSQSLSTFSGHLKQISDIQSKSTKQSLVLLDEVGAGTNPLEGAALGMSLLESFANGALLTIATTHHGELKTLKYSAASFENACMEFDEVNLKPTYKILWGIPGRSNAISIAERLGLPGTIVNDARELYGSASAEINELITDMEKYKQEFRELQRDSQSYLMLARDLHRKLLAARRRIEEQRIAQKNKMFREISEAAAVARSMLHKRVREFRASQVQRFQPIGVKTSPKSLAAKRQHSIDEDSKDLVQRKSTIPSEPLKQSSLDSHCHVIHCEWQDVEQRYQSHKLKNAMEKAERRFWTISVRIRATCSVKIWLNQPGDDIPKSLQKRLLLR